MVYRDGLSTARIFARFLQVLLGIIHKVFQDFSLFFSWYFIRCFQNFLWNFPNILSREHSKSFCFSLLQLLSGVFSWISSQTTRNLSSRSFSQVFSWIPYDDISMRISYTKFCRLHRVATQIGKINSRLFPGFSRYLKNFSRFSRN